MLGDICEHAFHLCCCGGRHGHRRPVHRPVVLMGAWSAHADISGYRRCVGNIREVPLGEPDPLSLQLSGLIEQDLNSGVSPAAEAQKVALMGFDPRCRCGCAVCYGGEPVGKSKRNGRVSL
jgi:hypothetical protein